MQYKLMVYLNGYIKVLIRINSILNVVWIGLYIYEKVRLAELVEYIMGLISASSGHMSMYP